MALGIGAPSEPHGGGMYRLSREMIDSLLRKPESGMGYQLVAARMGDYELANGVVLGGRLLLLEADQDADRRLLRTRSLPELAESVRGRFRHPAPY